MGEIHFVSHIVDIIRQINFKDLNNILEIEGYLNSLIIPVRNITEISSDLMDVSEFCNNIMDNEPTLIFLKRTMLRVIRSIFFIPNISEAVFMNLLDLTRIGLKQELLFKQASYTLEIACTKHASFCKSQL